MPPLHYLCEGALPMISDLLFYKLLLGGTPVAMHPTPRGVAL